MNLEELKTTLTETELVSSTQLDALLAELPEDARPADGEALLRLLIAQELITFYQGQVLLRGKGKSLRLGKYLIQNKLGQGGMGMVFHARHVTMKREVALKVVSGKVTKNAEMMQRFQREVQATGKLHHPNIVVAHDASEDNGTAYMVMEYIEGKDLSAIVKKKGPLTISQAINMIRQTALGLEYAHAQGVIHRDIKPSNLFLDHSGTVKILDMGLARFEDEEAAELTATGAVMGTIDYMAPEQALSTKDANEQSDIYSLGCTLWYLLLAKPMYGGESMIAKVLAHRSQPTPSLLDECEDFPADLQAIFERMVAKKPENRYASMSELIADLEKFKSGDSDLTAMSSIYTSDEDQLEEFLEVPGATAASPQVASRTKSRSVPSMSDVDTDHEFQSFMLPPVAGRPTRVKRKKRSAWWQDWRVLSIMGGGLAIILMIVLFAGRGGSKNSTPSIEPEKVQQDSEVAGSVTNSDPSEGTPLEPDSLDSVPAAVPNDPEKIKNEVLAPDKGIAENFKQEVYEFLVHKPELTDWKPLTIASTKTEKGSVLTGQADGSLLASGDHIAGETYDLTVFSREPEIHAIRLEALTHSSLPRNGPGRNESGDFWIQGFRVYRGGSSNISEQNRIPFIAALTDYESLRDDTDVEAILDDRREEFWHVGAEVGKPHVAVLIPAQPIVMTPEDFLTIRITQKSSLGCFRLSTASAPLNVRHEKLLWVLRRQAFDDSLSTSAACLIKNNPEQARRYLERNPSRPPTDPQYGNQLLLQCLIASELDDRELQRETYQRLIAWNKENYFSQSPLRRLAAELMMELGGMDREHATRFTLYAWFQDRLTDFRTGIDKDPANPGVGHYWFVMRLGQLGRWQEAADVARERLKYHPEDISYWASAAVNLAMAGNDEGYRETCRDFVRKFAMTKSPREASVVCHICLLKPGTVPLSRLPAKPLQSVINDSESNENLRNLATMALGAYREKKYRECLSFAHLPCQCPDRKIKALGLIIRSMAEFQTGETVQAEASYREVESLLPVELLTLEPFNDDKPNILGMGSVEHAWLIPTILRREAMELIFPNAPPTPMTPENAN